MTMTNNHKQWIGFSIFSIFLLIPFSVRSDHVVFQGGVPDHSLKPNPSAFYSCSGLSSDPDREHCYYLTNVMICDQVVESWNDHWLTFYMDGAPSKHSYKTNGMFDCVNTEAFMQLSPPPCINKENKQCDCWVCANATGVENQFDCLENPADHIQCSDGPPPTPPTTTTQPPKTTTQPPTTITQPPTTTTTTTTATTTTATTSQPTSTATTESMSSSQSYNTYSTATAIIAAGGASVAVASAACCLNASKLKVAPNAPAAAVPKNFVANFAGCVEDVEEMMEEMINPDDVLVETESGETRKVTISMFKSEISRVGDSPDASRDPESPSDVDEDGPKTTVSDIM